MVYKLPKGFDIQYVLKSPFGVRRDGTIQYFDRERSMKEDNLEDLGYVSKRVLLQGRGLKPTKRPTLEELGNYDVTMWGRSDNEDEFPLSVASGEMVLFEMRDPKDWILAESPVSIGNGLGIVERLLKDGKYLEGVFLKAHISDVPYQSELARLLDSGVSNYSLNVYYKPIEFMDGFLIKPNERIVSLPLLSRDINRISVIRKAREDNELVDIMSKRLRGETEIEETWKALGIPEDQIVNLKKVLKDDR